MRTVSLHVHGVVAARLSRTRYGGFRTTSIVLTHADDNDTEVVIFSDDRIEIVESATELVVDELPEALRDTPELAL